MPGTLNGKVALVTGGASGIGRATALTFAREGAKLVVADMNVDGGQQTVHMITENGGEATFLQVDVSNATEVQAMIYKAVETYGRLDKWPMGHMFRQLFGELNQHLGQVSYIRGMVKGFNSQRRLHTAS